MEEITLNVDDIFTDSLKMKFARYLSEGEPYVSARDRIVANMTYNLMFKYDGLDTASPEARDFFREIIDNYYNHGQYMESYFG